MRRHHAGADGVSFAAARLVADDPALDAGRNLGGPGLVLRAVGAPVIDDDDLARRGESSWLRYMPV
jgi:hypothetical protein